VLTTFVVVVTANHYWLDGVAAVVLLAPAYLIARSIERVRNPVERDELVGDLELEPVWATADNV
jgi:hypothetical protein